MVQTNLRLDNVNITADVRIKHPIKIFQLPYHLVQPYHPSTCYQEFFIFPHQQMQLIRY